MATEFPKKPPTAPELKELLDQLEAKIEHDVNNPAIHILSLRLLALARQQKRPQEQSPTDSFSTATEVTVARTGLWPRIRSRFT